jgi:hypothetical protein
VVKITHTHLVEPIDMEKLFKLSSELKKYIEIARQTETATKIKTCNSATKLAVIVCSNGQWRQNIKAIEDNDGGECDPTYINQSTNERGVVALFSCFENDA